MHSTPFPKIAVLFVISSVLLCPNVFGQKKADVEVDVSKCWSYPLGDAAGEQIVTDDTRIFLELSGARIEALSLDGKKIWSSELGGEISSNILALNGSLFFTTSVVSSDATKAGGNKLRWVSKETGITNWTVILPDASRYFLAGFNDTVIVVSKNGAVESIDARNGTVKWTRQIAEGFVAEPSFTGTNLTIATAANQLFGISFATGEIESMRKVSFGVTAVNAAANGKLVVGDERGNVFTVAGDDRPIWTFKTGAAISNIVNLANNILVASHDNFVYYLAAKNGGRVWKRRFPRRVAHMANVSDRFALISSYEERGGILTDLSNGRVAGQIAFEEGERLVAEPIVSSGLVFVLTNATLYAYSLNGCPPEAIKAALSQNPSTTGLK